MATEEVAGTFIGLVWITSGEPGAQSNNESDDQMIVGGS
jgi:hypothetical protein